MKITGIIAEYDPFHRGHAWQLAEAKRRGADALLIVMSGSFVQRGGPAVTDKWRRTQMALAGGAGSELGSGGLETKLRAAQMVMGDKKLIASVTVCGVVDSYTWQGKTVHCH